MKVMVATRHPHAFAVLLPTHSGARLSDHGDGPDLRLRARCCGCCRPVRRHLWMGARTGHRGRGSLRVAQAVGTAHLQTSTGLDNRKLLMWPFLGSECLFFGSLIAAYLLYRDRSVAGPYPSDLFDIPFTSVSAFQLLMSSVSMVVALSAIHQGNLCAMQRWLFTTAILGTIFVS